MGMAAYRWLQMSGLQSGSPVPHESNKGPPWDMVAYRCGIPMSLGWPS